MRIKFYFLFYLIICTYSTHAQVRTNYNNKATIDSRGIYKKVANNVFYDIATPDSIMILNNDSLFNIQNTNAKKPYRFAEPITINLDFSTVAQWTSDSGYQIGKLNLRIKKAKSLSVIFTPFFLPSGSEMYIYNADGQMVSGPITESENNKSQNWGSAIYQGEILSIEVKVPTDQKVNLKLTISTISFGYKQVFGKAYGFGTSGSCNVNVMCPDGSAWANERNSVALVALANQSALCSGCMVANTCYSNWPYFLTANHCISNQNVGTWQFVFQYFSPQCSPTTEGSSLLFNGASLDANWATSDFALLTLNQTPSSNSNIYYAGWSRSTTAPTSGVGIHHPHGDVMKISTYTTPLLRSDNFTWTQNGQVLSPPGSNNWVVSWNRGVTEPGSSGSPLFDQNHRVVGQLGGGPSICGGSQLQDAYGRFDNSWTGGGTSTTSLSTYLDPANTGALTTNTTNISALSPPPYLSISGPDNYCSGTQTYTLNGVPQLCHGSVSWGGSPSGLATLTPHSNNTCDVTMVSA